MSHSTDYTKQLKVDVKMTPREYYQFRLLAIQYNVHFLVKWEKDHCMVTTELPFIISQGYIEGVDF